MPRKRPARAGKLPTEEQRLAILVRELALDQALQEGETARVIRSALRAAREGASFEVFIELLTPEIAADLIAAAEAALNELKRGQAARTARPQSRKKGRQPS